MNTEKKEKELQTKKIYTKKRPTPPSSLVEMSAVVQNSGTATSRTTSQVFHEMVGREIFLHETEPKAR